MDNQKKTIQNLLQILSLSCEMEQWQIARDTLTALAPYGFVYKKQEEHAVFAISGTVYRVPLVEKKAPVEPEIPDFSMLLDSASSEEDPVYCETSPQMASFKDEKETPAVIFHDKASVSSDGLLASILKDIDDFAANPVMQPKEEIPKQEAYTPERTDTEDTVPADAFGGMFRAPGGLDELEELERMYGNDTQEEAKREPVDFFPEREVAPADKATDETVEVETAEVEKAAPLADFSRMDADGAPEKTPTFRNRRTDQVGETDQGFQPPLTSEIVNNFKIPLSDCVYSIFLADVYEEQAINKQRIFFMVAPFEVTEDSPSINILFYAYTDHVPYCTTSLKNHDKNSLVCQIGQFQFLVRGSILNGKWQAEVKLTGESLRRGDILEIKQVKHFSPENLGQTNGHIRFRYKGHINRPDLTSTGCINIFPIDPNTKDCVIVRCMEDFIDYAFTDQKKELKLQTAEHGIKQLHVFCENNVLHTAFSDYIEVEEGELTI